MLKTKFQNVLKSVMHFENYVSTLLEMLDMVFMFESVLKISEHVEICSAC